LSAASGLVRIERTLYVVADDELQLGFFNVDDDTPVRLLRLGARALELDPVLRKREKPDFEALVHIPRTGRFAHGGLLALGSGSTTQRLLGSWIELNAHGAPTGHVLPLKLQHLYKAVAREVGEVNIEGAVVCGEQLMLVQRGNKGVGINALIGFDLRVVQAAMEDIELPQNLEPMFVDRFDLGTSHGVPLGFSDAAALPNGATIFSAIAEDTSDAYADGACAGAAIGIIDSNRALQLIRPVQGDAKIEGITADLRGTTIDLLMVTDADDVDVAASLYSAQLKLPE
jgi:hypothetical protein